MNIFRNKIYVNSSKLRELLSMNKKIIKQQKTVSIKTTQQTNSNCVSTKSKF